MKRTMMAVAVAALAAVAIWAQRDRAAPLYVPLEVASVFPREISPGKFEQVPQRQLDLYAQQGWELVSVMPYIYRNEERGGPELQGIKPVVTQTYPAYFFKRTRLVQPPQ